MAGTITVREALRRVCVLLQDISPQYVRWPEQELVDWLNDAQAAIVKYLPSAHSRVDAIKLKAGPLQSIALIAQADHKPGDGSTPTGPVQGNLLLDVLNNMGSDGQTEGDAIRVLDRKILDSQNPGWRLAARAKTTVRQYAYDPLYPRYFHVNPPVPTGATVWVRVAYTAQPLAIPNTGTPGSETYLATGGSTLTLSVADEFIDDVVNYVVARANMKDVEWADGNKVTAFTALFTASINAKAQALTGTNPNLKRLPFAPDPVGAAS